MRETQIQCEIHGIDRQGIALVFIVTVLALVLTTVTLWIGLR